MFCYNVADTWFVESMLSIIGTERGSQLCQLFVACGECSVISILYKKALPSQRWPRNAPYTWVLWKCSGLPDYAHGYYSQHIFMGFCSDRPYMNVPTKFEVPSFTRSWDNRGYPNNWAVPGYAHAPFSPKFLMGFYSNWPCKMYSPNLKYVASHVPEIRPGT